MSKIILRYLLITLLFMLLGWGSCLLLGMFGVYLSDHPMLYVPYILGGFSPTLASIFICMKQDGKKGFRNWLTATFDFRQQLISYMLLLVLVGAFFFMLCLLCPYTKGAPLFAVVIMIPMMLFGGGLEETGWRGFLQPELEKKCGYTIATIIVALIWWVWHLPLFYIVGTGQYGSNFLAFGVNVLGLSFALSAVKRVTGSTWLCVLLHCIVNSLHGVYIVQPSLAGNAAAAVVLILLSYLVVGLQEKKQVFHRELS